MRVNLKQSILLIFGSEDGFVDDENDRGGATKYGVTIGTLGNWRGRKVTVDDVRNLTIAEAEEIYRVSFWPLIGGDIAPSGLDYMLMDAGVMSGPQRVVRWLQEVLATAGVYDGKIDGWYGTGTHAGVMKYPGGIEALLHAFAERRLRYYRGIKEPGGWKTYGRGWERRLTGVDPKGLIKTEPGVIGNAIRMARGNKITKPAEVAPPTPSPAVKADTTVIDAIQKPEVLTFGGALVSAFTSMSSGSAVLQYTAAGIAGLFAIIAAIYIVRRILRDND